jgi:hypothetical protein
MRTRLMIIVMGLALGITVKWLIGGWTGNQRSPSSPRADEAKPAPAAVRADPSQV